MCVSLTKQQRCAAHNTQQARTTLTTNMHNPPIMASSFSAFDRVCGACASSNKGGKYCTMCATPRLMHKAVLAPFAADVAAPLVVFAAPREVAKVILSAPKHGAVDVAMPAVVVTAPAVVAKAIPSASMPRAVVGVPAPKGGG
jgi:hypothetical protein